MTTDVDLSSVGGALLDNSPPTYFPSIDDSPLSLNSHLEAAFHAIGDLVDFTTNVRFHAIFNPAVWREWKRGPVEMKRAHIAMVKRDIRRMKILRDKVDELIKDQMEILDSWDPIGARTRSSWIGTDASMIPDVEGD